MLTPFLFSSPLKTISKTPFLFSSICCISSHKIKKPNWNISHSFILSNPILNILETKCKSMHHLKQIHSQMIITGLVVDGLASSRLVAFCALSQTPDLEYCRTLLDYLINPKVFSWNIVIRAFSDSETPQESIFLYKEMLKIGKNWVFGPDNYTFPLLFKVCARLMLFEVGLQVFGHVLKMGYENDVFVHNSWIFLLVSCGELEAADKVFGESCVRNLVTWNSLINGYVRSGNPGKALRVFREMEVEGVEPDDVTMIGVVSSIAQVADLDLGREIYRCIVEKGLNNSVRLNNALIDMYIKCGDLVEAKMLFDRMEDKTIVSWTTMVVGYARYGFLEVAHKLFDEMPEKDVYPWNALISGYVQAKRSKEALCLFHEMQASSIMPDEVTMVSCLSACSLLGALDVGIWIHRYIEKHKLYLNVAVGTALIDMYAKCGNMKRALQVFNEMPQRNSLTWTAIIGGLALHGDAQKAIYHFWEMVGVGLVPDEITFLGVLSACCHGGLVQEGRHIFAQMSSRFHVSPRVKHYSCMVDLLGRAGLLQEAEELIKTMPMEADAVVWGALFFACRIHKNIEIGERAAFRLLELDPDDSAIYVLLASMYVEANMWQRAREVRQMMKDRGVEKNPGCSSIEVNGVVSEFIIRDKSHPQTNQIYECLIQLSNQMELGECVFF
ncbi:hypothetical protein LIER_12520 [Lithospermum erythrorhizon]|uniref:Pentatricopeptide repeat-containing protein At2g22410, mitochondrial-like n=1 Tax=Lithospermum erythrorhizon TaxID=34254 RepID=A0AAV3PW73_LITER